MPWKHVGQKRPDMGAGGLARITAGIGQDIQPQPVVQRLEQVGDLVRRDGVISTLLRNLGAQIDRNLEPLGVDILDQFAIGFAAPRLSVKSEPDGQILVGTDFRMKMRIHNGLQLVLWA